MKIILQLIFMFNCLQLFSQEQWEMVVPAQNSDKYQGIYFIEDKIYQIDLNSNFSIYNTNTQQVEKQSKLGDDMTIFARGFYNNKFYFSTIRQSGSDSRTLILDDKFNIIDEKPFLNFSIISSYLFTQNAIYYSVITIPGPKEGIAISDPNFENIKLEFIKNESGKASYINPLVYNNDKINFLTSSGSLYTMTDISKLEWVQNDELENFNLDSARGLFVSNDTIVISNESGRILVSIDGGINFTEKTNFGSNYLAIGCSLKNSRLFVWGRTLDKKNAIVYMSKNLGESWETIFENEGIVSSVVFENNKIYCQVGTGQVYSVDEDVYLSVEKNEKICKTLIPIKYYDVLGNE